MIMIAHWYHRKRPSHIELIQICEKQESKKL
uniref:Uncharacterized protein n=1 Tax=Arundo donax TaxID=35708 RepID=A0A0A9GWE1_ARUDO